MEKFLNKTANKEAIKIALAISASICCALWLQWEKPYWSAMAALVMGMNESFGHAIKKGRHRLLGTAIGVSAGIVLISFLSQDRWYFLVALCVIMAFCVFMASDKDYGYIYTTSFTVCIIVASVGGFDSQTTFDILLLRIQETVLGVIIFSVVFRLLWPKGTEDAFFLLFGQTHKKLMSDYESLISDIASGNSASLNLDYQYYTNNINKLHEYLSVPLKGSYQLQHRRHQWLNLVKAISVAQYYLKLIKTNLQNSTADSKQKAYQHDKQQTLLKHCISYLQGINGLPHDNGKNNPQAATAECPQDILLAYESLSEQAKPALINKKNYRLDSYKALKSQCIFITALLLWIYIPIPDSYLFPMNAGIFACLLSTMPDGVLKHWMWGYLGFGLTFIAQYVLIMPMMTEIWQLAGFYFINMFVIWRIFSKPQFIIHRIIGGNLMMMMTMGALHRVPSYSIETSLRMLIYIMMSLIVVQFYTHLFSKVITKA
ncbi:FUSC family protein [Shewanella sp. UCD-KL21]|uniref:FUSC family protein n=1 Tax=Shewanella sp. UCD-KL21 TaxID=1917164 RepID=UPI000971450B|nr:FUSC family protein [Shewanella sp. UCD-KL21]